MTRGLKPPTRFRRKSRVMQPGVPFRRETGKAEGRSGRGNRAAKGCRGWGSEGWMCTGRRRVKRCWGGLSGTTQPTGPEV